MVYWLSAAFRRGSRLVPPLPSLAKEGRIRRMRPLVVTGRFPAVRLSSNGVDRADEEYHVKPYDAQGDDGGTLRPERVGDDAQYRRNDGAARHADDQQGRDLVRPFGNALHRDREDDREQIGVTDSEYGDAGQHGPEPVEEDHAYETCQCDEYAGREEFAFGELHQQDAAEECAHRACEEVDTVAHAGVRKRQVAALPSAAWGR